MQDSHNILWTGGFFNERFPAPVSPLGWSLIGPQIEELGLRDPLRYLGYPDAGSIPLTRLWHGHPYANALAFHILYKPFPDAILPEDAYRYFLGGDVSIRKRAPYPRWSDTPRLLFSLFRAFFSDPFNILPLNNYRHWARFVREYDRRIAGLRARMDALGQADAREIFVMLADAERAQRDLLRIHRWSLIDADLTFGLLRRLARAWIDREHGGDIAAQLVADVPNKTMQVDAALRELPLDQFLAEHGHRSFSLDIAEPTFAEEPEKVARMKTKIDERRKTMDECLPSSFVYRPPSLYKRIPFGAVLSLARKYLALREDERYYWQKGLAISRRLYLLLADRLVMDGVIGDRSAVFYATHQELVDYSAGGLPKMELGRSIASRQAEWRGYQREYEQSPTTAYPAFLNGDAPAKLEQANSDVTTVRREWHGRAISPGVGRGAARVIKSFNDLSRLQPGEILVAPATDPAWTPVFANIAGLVVERGGVLSHSAVVAREYHVPGVAGIPNIVNEIQDGEEIEVDGSRGVVQVVE